MKYIYLFLFIFSVSFQLQAQTAGDFTLKDLNGEEFNLYETLSENKAVVIDFSATWCGPCWAMHQSGVLEQLQDEHGPEGDNILEVIYVESDPATTDDCMYGLTASCSGGTQGNWVENTPYRMFNPANNNVPSDYSISAYPTVVVVSAIDGEILYKDHSITYQGILDIVEKQGILSDEMDLEIRSFDPSPSVCGSLETSTLIRNKSKVDIVDPVINLVVDGTVATSTTYTGTLMSGESANITFEKVTMSEGVHDVSVQIEGDDYINENNMMTSTITAQQTTNEITVFIKKGSLKDNTTYIIYDGEGNEVYPAANIIPVKDHEMVYKMPELGCFSVYFTDGFGQGIVGDDAILISDSDGKIIYQGSSKAKELSLGFNVSTITKLDLIEELQDISIYPNPIRDQFNLSFELNKSCQVQAQIINQVGQIVETQNFGSLQAGSFSHEFNVENIQAGLYFVQLNIDGKIASYKVVKH